MYGWTGRVLHIDLTDQSIRVEKPCLSDLNAFIGGKGMGGKYLYDVATRPWDDPDMVVCLFTGPLVGTTAPTSGRAHLVSKSPQTGLIGDASVGGKLGTRLKQAGFDGMVIRGISPAPVGIIIDNHHVTIKNAQPEWGMETSRLFNRIRAGKAALACIGPAAENGVRFANLIVDRHFAAGRTGLGLSFAHKKIKYILVNGTGRCRIKSPEKLKQAREKILRLTAASPALMGQFGFTNLGTAAVYDLIDNRRMMPTDNFKSTSFKHAGHLNASAYKKKYAPLKHGCKGCHIQCKKTGMKNKTKKAMPEFETMSHFTALIGCNDTDLVVEANALCNEMGMDTISAASVLACRREILKSDYTPQMVLSLLKKIAHAEGEGKDLAMGAAGYAKKMGKPEKAMAVKGLELPAYDPRGAFGMALGYAMSTRGGCHLRAYPISHEILRKPVATDRFSFSGKARIIKITEDINAAVDSLTACKFTFFAASLEEYAESFEAVTGIETSGQDLLKKGERIYYNDRMINFKNGFDHTHDMLPERFFNEPGSSGNNMTIAPIDKTIFLETVQKYYTIRGLDQKGRPLKKKAAALNLPWQT